MAPLIGKRPIRLSIDATSAAAPSWSDFNAASMTVVSAIMIGSSTLPGLEAVVSKSSGSPTMRLDVAVTISPVATEEFAMETPF